MTAGDPFEYGEPSPAITNLGAAITATGPLVESSGRMTLLETPCVGINYDPMYDPTGPALIEPPAPPNLYPANWGIAAGMTFTRYWTRISPVEPGALNYVPVFTVTADAEARMVRLSVWPDASDTADQCDPLFSVVLTYVPGGTTSELVVDGEQKVVYYWDGVSTSVQRADSLAYSPEAGPVEWAGLSDAGGFLVTLDKFSDGAVQTSLVLVPKSD
jgi:hypothetical protein